MKLNKFTDYSLRVLMYLAAYSNKRVQIKEICDYFHISKNHIAKVVYNLVQEEYVKSIRGKGGGLMLAVAEEHIRLGDLVQKLEENSPLAECFNPKKNQCRLTNSCHLKNILKETENLFYENLNQYSLKHIKMNIE